MSQNTIAATSDAGPSSSSAPPFSFGQQPRQKWLTDHDPGIYAEGNGVSTATPPAPLHSRLSSERKYTGPQRAWVGVASATRTSSHAPGHLRRRGPPAPSAARRQPARPESPRLFIARIPGHVHGRTGLRRPRLAMRVRISYPRAAGSGSSAARGTAANSHTLSAIVNAGRTSRRGRPGYSGQGVVGSARPCSSDQRGGTMTGG